MSWLEKIIPPRIKKTSGSKKTIPDGVWVKCPQCESVLYRADLDSNLQVCPKCKYHLRISARKRAEHLINKQMISFIGSDCHNMKHASLYKKCQNKKSWHDLHNSNKLLNYTL